MVQLIASSAQSPCAVEVKPSLALRDENLFEGHLRDRRDRDGHDRADDAEEHIADHEGDEDSER